MPDLVFLIALAGAAGLNWWMAASGRISSATGTFCGFIIFAVMLAVIL